MSQVQPTTSTTPLKPDLSCLEVITRILQIIIWCCCFAWTIYVIRIPNQVERELKSMIPDYREPIYGSGLSGMGVSQQQIFYIFAGFVLAYSVDKILRALQLNRR